MCSDNIEVLRRLTRNAFISLEDDTCPDIEIGAKLSRACCGNCENEVEYDESVYLRLDFCIGKEKLTLYGCLG